MQIDHYFFEPNLPKTAREQLRTGVDSIDNLKLDRIIAKSIHPVTEIGWSLDQALDISDLYRVFLYLCLTYPNKIIVPPREVDEFWHLHILDTRNYALDCQNVFGYYLHHFPYAGLSEKNDSVESQAIEETIELVRFHFPSILSEA